jgi:hypothetical protein
VRHDGRGRQNDIETVGTLPLGFESIKTDWLAKGERDLELRFEMAIDIAAAVTGYRDGGAQAKITERGYELLIPAGARERDQSGVGQWFKRLLLGRKQGKAQERFAKNRACAKQYQRQSPRSRPRRSEGAG